MRVLHVVGARPNFIKIAPIMHALASRSDTSQVLVHTGQHAHPGMSDVFLEELDIPEPDFWLGIDDANRPARIERMAESLRGVLGNVRPDCVVVVGDVDSTRAGAVAASACRIPCAHVEAGLRSFDLSMPEESNRKVIDRESELLFAPSRNAVANLLAEGAAASSIHLVGNVMIDTLKKHLARAKQRPILDRLGLHPRRYALATVHRPRNVDDEEALARIVDALGRVAAEIPVVLPLHPRAAARIEDQGLGDVLSRAKGLRTTRPLGYLDFVGLLARAQVVVTDSGGLQEETTALGVPCLTLRETTERPVTVDVGTNTLVGTDPDRILSGVTEVLEGRAKRGAVPELWDGRTSERIVDVLLDRFAGRSVEG